MNIDEIKKYFASTLNDYFKWDVVCPDANQDHPLLFILDYSCNDELNLASFAFCLSGYDAGTFPSKCWMTNEKVREINGKKPSYNLGYEEICYKDSKDIIFHPFSVDLSRFNFKNDKDAVKTIVKELYCHIDWT